MTTQDTVLSIDLTEDDCLYRILREVRTHKRVLYVMLQHLDLIPEESRTFGPDVIRELSKLEEWSGEWKTLTISKDGTGVRKQPDIFQPHALSNKQMPGLYNLFDITELRVIESVKSRVSRVQQGGTQCFLKIARFGFEVESLAREVKAYHTLAHHNSGLAPRILGYAYEETRDRVIGLVFETVTGRHPNIADLEICQTALRKLHQLGIIHGDVNRYNMFITESGAKFIDFEESYVGPIGKQEDWEHKKDKEVQSLQEKLSDESGEGRPWTIDEDAS